MKATIISLFLISICFNGFSQASTPLSELKSIFNNYVKYQESTDSQKNKTKVTQALKTVEKEKLQDCIPILLDFYLYYDPTDYRTREYVTSALRPMKAKAIIEVKKRMSLERQKVASENDFPYSDLQYLLSTLEK